MPKPGFNKVALQICCIFSEHLFIKKLLGGYFCKYTSVLTLTQATLYSSLSFFSMLVK